MRRHVLSLLLLSGLVTMLEAQARQVAITIDDLPAVAVGDHAEVELLTTTMLAALEAHGVTAVGFVNAGKVEADSAWRTARLEVLRRWLAAGHALGNHGAYHLSANDAPLPAFLADLAAGDAVPRALSLEAGRPYQWYRLPYLHSGTTDTARAAIDSALTAHALRVAPVSLDPKDWLFAAAWRGALRQQDTTSMRRVERAFLAYTDAIVAYHERLAEQVAGRRVAHVLLLHANPMTAAVLEQLLTQLHARRYAIVPLDAALRDEVYARPDRYRGTVGLAWLERLAIYQRGVRIDDVPEPPSWVQALARDADAPHGSGSSAADHRSGPLALPLPLATLP